MTDFQSAVVYQIYIRSFYDADGDGYGDLSGVIKKLPYLASLGIGYIWLNPFFPSPQRDNGYDVADYCAVDPMFGTMTELELLIAKAESYGIGIILDMVFNHTSTAHAWFQKALEGDPYYRNYYFFKPAGVNGAPPTNWTSKFGGSAWQKVPNGDEYYLHLYDKEQADLNWANENVRNELHDILLFWLAKGIRGFRFDVINVISKSDVLEDDFIGDGRRFYTDGRRVEEYLKEIHQVLHQANPSDKPLLLVGELSSTSPEKCVPYCRIDSDELSMVFHFQHLKVDYPQEDEKWALSNVDFHMLRSILHDWQVDMCTNNAWDALFWNNHDQPRALTRFASKKKKYHYQSATMLASTIHFMRGTPYVYMGEEIGMINPEFDDIRDYKDVETLNYYEILRNKKIPHEEVMAIIKMRSRDNSRTPMQWTSGPGAGFTKGVPWIKAADNKCHINVESETNKGSGILAYYKKLIALRKKYDIIQTGNYRPMLLEIDSLIAYQRETKSQLLICIHNFSDRAIRIPQQYLCAYADLHSEVIISNYGYTSINFRGPLVMQPYESVAILLDK